MLEQIERLKSRIETLERHRKELAEIARHAHAMDGDFGAKRWSVLKEIELEETEQVKPWGAK